MDVVIVLSLSRKKSSTIPGRSCARFRYCAVTHTVLNRDPHNYVCTVCMFVRVHVYICVYVYRYVYVYTYQLIAMNVRRIRRSPCSYYRNRTIRPLTVLPSTTPSSLATDLVQDSPKAASDYCASSAFPQIRAGVLLQYLRPRVLDSSIGVITIYGEIMLWTNERVSRHSAATTLSRGHRPSWRERGQICSGPGGVCSCSEIPGGLEIDRKLHSGPGKDAGGGSSCKTRRSSSTGYKKAT